MERIIISESEIIEALASARRELPSDPPGAFTVKELSLKARKAPATIRAEIDTLRAKGLIEEVQLYRSRSNGRPIMVPGFRVLKAAPAKARR